MTREQRKQQRKLRLIAGVVTLALVAVAAHHGDKPTVTQETPQPAELIQPTVEATPAPVKAQIEPPARYDITEEELDLVAKVVHSEACGEGYDGQALVAQCILNTAEATGKRPDEVVLEPRQYAKPAAEANEEVKAAVRAVFLDGYQVTEEPVRYFYAPAHCTSEWHETALEYVLTHGGHRFFKE